MINTAALTQTVVSACIDMATSKTSVAEEASKLESMFSVLKRVIDPASDKDQARQVAAIANIQQSVIAKGMPDGESQLLPMASWPSFFCLTLCLFIALELGKRLFDCLHKAEILTEVAFNKWKDDVDNVDTKFLMSVNVFLQYLAQAEAEDAE